MAKPVLSDLDFGGAVRILNLPDPTLAQHPATKNYVDSALEGLAWKTSCKVATQANVAVASPGATVDGISMSVGDRVLFKSQTAPAENGIYVWNGAAVAAARALDCNVSAEFNQAVVTVNQGTSANASFRQTAVNPTVGTTAIAWASFGTAAGAATTGSAGVVRLATQGEVDTGTDATVSVTPATLAAAAARAKRFAASFGDGSATQYTLSHNLGTFDTVVQVERVSDHVKVACDMACPTTNTVQLNFAVAPTANQYRVTVLA